MFWWTLLIIALLIVVGVVLHDVFQTQRAILRNFPLVGHARYFLEDLGPKLRQYIVAGNDEERPFTRDQRNWISRSATKSNNYFGFGTDNNFDGSGSYLIIKQAMFPIKDIQPDDPLYDSHYQIPAAKIIGEARDRQNAFRPASIINISAMSFGSLSGAAVEAMNRGARIAGCLHNTGEGGISHHHDHGGSLIWQLGTGYYGARRDDGRFDEKRFAETCQRFPVKAVEIKLSQGAKPGRGGVLPGKKVTAEIASIRGIPIGKSCLSPASHIEFSNADELLDFVERIADLAKLPVGIKSAVGELDFWDDLVQLMATGDRGVDFITIDGGEGGTGAAPLTFADHVALPFKVGMRRVHQKFVEAGLHQNVFFVGSGKLGFPEEAVLAMALGCDAINVAREAMLSVGCIQAQICHTGRCPTGVATQNKWLMRGLDPTEKSARLANYVTTLRKEILQLTHACGLVHPGLLTTDQFEILQDSFQSRPLADCFPEFGSIDKPTQPDAAKLTEIMDNLK